MAACGLDFSTSNTTLGIAVDAKPELVTLESGQTTIPSALSWVEPDLGVAISRADLMAHTKELAARIAARIKVCLKQARLAAEDIDVVFLTGGSAQLAHVRRAIVQNVPDAQVIEGDTFGAVGKGLTIEAARRFGSGLHQPRR